MPPLAIASTIRNGTGDGYHRAIKLSVVKSSWYLNVFFKPNGNYNEGAMTLVQIVPELQDRDCATGCIMYCLYRVIPLFSIEDYTHLLKVTLIRGTSLNFMELLFYIACIVLSAFMVLQ